jgi:hypothetical protein
MYFAGESASGSENIYDLFARYFDEVYADSVLGSLSFTAEDVDNRHLGLDASKGSGPDGIPPRILKSFSDGFKRPLNLVY